MTKDRGSFDGCYAIRRTRIQVRGIVQGVGFRPFVYTTAQALGLTGHVFNSTAGVTIEVEGYAEAIAGFLKALRESPPPLAEVGEVHVAEISPRGDTAFQILESHRESGEFALVPSDAGTCDECWREVTDPANRRFGYPFTNCTHCGPRYTIVLDIPYDRALTTMAPFTMCPECAAEYTDPTDRRFHAQPNACPRCGPELVLLRTGEALQPSAFDKADSLKILHEVRTVLKAGAIVAIRGLGGFLLACDANNKTAVEALRRRKKRPSKPFALMARDLAATRALCEVSACDALALTSPRRPIVVMPRKSSALVDPGVAPGNPTLGIMLPYTPLHYLLFSETALDTPAFGALVMTSGNMSEEPIVISNEQALERLNGIADWFLLHNREIAMRADDSVVRCFEGHERVLRRSRGYVPQTIALAGEVPEVLAFGAELKNTFCLTKGRHAILSQHIGDLDNYETEMFFNETLARMQRLFKADPVAIAHDLHPAYRSTRMALACDISPSFGVQHHHAHIASCMAEHHLTGQVIGVAFDGTGFGTDGCIWGGEFMVADLAAFSRYAHLRYVPMAGGDTAVRQPWRMALSYLRDALGYAVPLDHPCFAGVAHKQLELVDAMLARGVQTVQTSSVGRLFDAIASLLGLAEEVTFEAEAAIALETGAGAGIEGTYPFDLHNGSPMVLDLRATVTTIWKALEQGRPVAEIAARFHNTLSAAVVEICSQMAAETGLRRVCLSGGSFQNMYLLGQTVVHLRGRGLEVFVHATVPANDGGIALGQAAVAAELLRRDKAAGK